MRKKTSHRAYSISVFWPTNYMNYDKVRIKSRRGFTAGINEAILRWTNLGTRLRRTWLIGGTGDGVVPFVMWKPDPAIAMRQTLASFDLYVSLRAQCTEFMSGPRSSRPREPRSLAAVWKSIAPSPAAPYSRGAFLEHGTPTSGALSTALCGENAAAQIANLVASVPQQAKRSRKLYAVRGIWGIPTNFLTLSAGRRWQSSLLILSLAKKDPYQTYSHTTSPTVSDFYRADVYCHVDVGRDSWENEMRDNRAPYNLAFIHQVSLRGRDFWEYASGSRPCLTKHRVFPTTHCGRSRPIDGLFSSHHLLT